MLLTPISAPPGDLDGDCIVGVSDFDSLLDNWGACPPQGECAADLDGNGTVNVVDFLNLLANWS
ncbi:MAG: hypothetical protein ACYTGF_08095 [Planctomycetota bacterium]